MLEPEPMLYKPEDLLIGQSIDIFGRKIVLYDCDDMTRAFYKDYLDLEQPSLPIEAEEKVHVQLSHPPHIGPGSEEDSLASCMALRPKPPRHDMMKLMENSGRVLRFEAKMANGLKEDAARKFILGIFLADDSVAVWEVRQRNSGQTEGKWAERSKKRNAATGGWLMPSDFYVGTTVKINGTPFHILKADEYTLTYMVSNPEMFQKAGIGSIVSR